MVTSPNRLDWEGVRHFTPEEWTTNPGMVSKELVMMVDQLREDCGHPIIIHVAWEPTGHEENSEHYLGLAVDLHIVDMPLFEQWVWAEQYAFRGIGLYPYWNNPGLHVDIRRTPRARGYRWWRDQDGVYKAVNKQLYRILVEEVC